MRLFALAAVLAAALLAESAAGAPLDLTTRELESFNLAGDPPDGPLEFLGGLAVTSADPDFGGLSGIEMLDKDTALMVSDYGAVVRARLVHENGRLVGLANAEIQTLFPHRQTSKTGADIEDVAVDPANPSRGVVVRERQANAMLTFDMRDGWPTAFKPKRVGADNRILRSNQGLESVTYAPRSSRYAGEVITIAEHPPPGQDDIPGWIAGIGAFSIIRRDGFDISSARFLPDGDLLLLERQFMPGWGIAMRLRRIAGDAIEVGARLDGTILLDAGMTSQIDNMEGLAVSRGADGRTILTLVSDDNFNSILQRTLILQFALNDGD